MQVTYIFYFALLCSAAKNPIARLLEGDVLDEDRKLTKTFIKLTVDKPEVQVEVLIDSSYLVAYYFFMELGKMMPEKIPGILDLHEPCSVVQKMIGDDEELDMVPGLAEHLLPAITYDDLRQDTSENLIFWRCKNGDGEGVDDVLKLVQRVFGNCEYKAAVRQLITYIATTERLSCNLLDLFSRYYFHYAVTPSSYYQAIYLSMIGTPEGGFMTRFLVELADSKDRRAFRKDVWDYCKKNGCSKVLKKRRVIPEWRVRALKQELTNVFASNVASVIAEYGYEF